MVSVNCFFFFFLSNWPPTNENKWKKKVFSVSVSIHFQTSSFSAIDVKIQPMDPMVGLTSTLPFLKNMCPGPL